MITPLQEEQASLYALGLLCPHDERALEAEMRAHADLRKLVRSLQGTASLLAHVAPTVSPSPTLKGAILRRVENLPAGGPPTSPKMEAELAFKPLADESGWKPLPLPGAFIKLLSFEPRRGYAVLMGKLEAGVRYPAHINAGPEDFVLLSGDLHVSGRRLGPGDFHHADGGSAHEENYSVEGCTLVAVLTTEDPLVAYAMS